MRKRNTESIGEVLKQFFEENAFFKRKLAESRVVTGWPKLLGKPQFLSAQSRTIDGKRAFNKKFK